MSSENNRAKHLKKEFIKSGAMLLLAIVLLVTAVLAWFGDTENASIEPFALAIDSNMEGVRLDEDTVADKVVILPAATKLSDESISASDLAKVIKIVPYRVISDKSGSADIELELEKGLYCYIDTEYEPGENLEKKYADVIHTNKNTIPMPDDNNKMYANFSYKNEDLDSETGEYIHTVGLIFWADYDATIETIKEGQIELNVQLTVKSANEN